MTGGFDFKNAAVRAYNAETREPASVAMSVFLHPVFNKLMTTWKNEGSQAIVLEFTSGGLVFAPTLPPNSSYAYFIDDFERLETKVAIPEAGDYRCKRCGGRIVIRDVTSLGDVCKQMRPACSVCGELVRPLPQPAPRDAPSPGRKSLE